MAEITFSGAAIRNATGKAEIFYDRDSLRKLNRDAEEALEKVRREQAGKR